MKPLALLVALLGAACAGEPRIDADSLAYRAAGIESEVQMRREYGGRKLVGELLEARDTGLLLLVTGKAGNAGRDRVILFPYPTLQGTRFEYLGKVKMVSQGKQADGAAIARLALLSRFPQGLSPDLLTQLLLAYEQSALAIAGQTVFKPDPDG